METQKKLSDYLHFYLGCKVGCSTDGICFTDYGTLISVSKGEGGQHEVYFGYKKVFLFYKYNLENIKPVLRPLSDMTEEECQKCGNMIYDFSDDPELNNHKPSDFEIGLAPEQFNWLLKKGFDLFGLIEAGLAIDSTKLNNDGN